MVIISHILATASGFGKNFTRPIDGIGLDIFLEKKSRQKYSTFR